MAIYRYTRDNSANGFCGLRVAVACRDGVRQQWFPVAPDAASSEWRRVQRRAEQIDRRWQAEQRAQRRAWQTALDDEQRGSDATKTGIRGIRLGFKKGAPQDNGGVSWWPMFRITVSVDATRHQEIVLINARRSIPEAWRQAIRRVCDLKGLPNRNRSTLYARPAPTRAEFEAARRALNRRREQSIPPSAVSIGAAGCDL